MASPSVESKLLVAADREPDPRRRSSVRARVRSAAVVLAPALAALTALLLHEFLPNLQQDAPTTEDRYAVLLQAYMAIMVMLAVAQWLWQPLRAGFRYYAPLLAGVAVWLAVWELLTLKLAWFPLPYFPGPDMVLEAVLKKSDDPNADREALVLLKSTYATLGRLAVGYFVGVALGLLCGVLMGWFREVRYWGVPVMKLLGPVPVTALVPTAMVLFPANFLTPVALIALVVWFPVTMLTMSGIINVPASYFDVARTLGARRGYLIFRVAIPAALPSIFIGLFMGLLASFLVAVVADGVGVSNGLGYYINWRQSSAEYDAVFGAVLIMAVLFSGIVTLLFKVRDRVLGWQKGVIRW